MPNNKKQRRREERKKKIEAQREAKRALEEQQAQQDAEELRARLRGLFGTPAIDELITDMARSSISTALSTATATAAATAASKSSSSSSSTTPPDGVMVCYHGSSAEHFVPGSKYLQMVTSYVSLLKKFGSKVQRDEAGNDFLNDEENQKIIFDDEFTNFIFALAVALYFNLPEKEKDGSFYFGLETWAEQKATAMFELREVINMGLNIKYCFKSYKTQSKQERSDNRLELLKKHRAIDTTRGLITVLSSETKSNDCNCMATKKSETKNMEKMQRCSGCREEFSNGLMKCKCNMAHYCSEACQLKHWPLHKLFCKEEKKYRRYGGNTSKNDDKKATKK